jgi:radical SAM superfamily enzyme YgiQ (UPF0313 family)
MPRVALVFPYFRTRTATEMLFAPLGIASLAGQLRQRDIETKAFDCTFATPAELRRDLAAYQPDIVGVYAMVSLTRNALGVAGMVRAELPGSLLVAGGPLPTVFPRRYTPPFDAVVRGEADVTFARFCRDYLAARARGRGLHTLPLGTYEGLFIDRDGLTVDNPAVHRSQSEIDALPLPDRTGFDHAAYQREWLQNTGCTTTSIILTLGCPYRCDFCSRPVYGDVLRRRRLDTVFAEIEQVRGLGYDRLWIADDTFTLSETYLREFCHRIAGSGMTWSCLSRANSISTAMARLMKDAGCYRVYLGLESGSDVTLELMNKQVTTAQGRRAARLYSQAGIEVVAFFIVGYPGETFSSMQQTFELALSLPLAEISFNVPVPLPGSRLFERLGRPDEGRDWTSENEVTFVYPSDVDEGWLRRRIGETMRAFARRQEAALGAVGEGTAVVGGGTAAVKAAAEAAGRLDLLPGAARPAPARPDVSVARVAGGPSEGRNAACLPRSRPQT